MTHHNFSDRPGDVVRRPPQKTQLEIAMQSALTPREIQTRVRSGQSLEEVAAAAGMGVDWVEPYAAPVLAEREFIAEQAQGHQVRRGGETVAHRTLAQVVQDRLDARSVDTESLRWDAWKLADRRWHVLVGYDSGKAHREAHFVYDAAGRFSVPDDDDARWLVGLHSASHGPQPTRRRREDEAEPTVGLNDELALVRVVQPRADEPEDPDRTLPILDDDAETDDAYAEADLTEVDGVYDIVPSQDAGLDVLYEMLSSFDEDSVQIYAGLIGPVQADPPAPVLDQEPGDSKSTTNGSGEAGWPDQPALVEQPEPVDLPAATPAATEAKPARTRRKRAEVPSWDEIMFGAPKNRR